MSQNEGAAWSPVSGIVMYRVHKIIDMLGNEVLVVAEL
jgi:hypothetical protein